MAVPLPFTLLFATIIILSLMTPPSLAVRNVALILDWCGSQLLLSHHILCGQCYLLANFAVSVMVIDSSYLKNSLLWEDKCGRSDMALEMMHLLLLVVI